MHQTNNLNAPLVKSKTIPSKEKLSAVNQSFFSSINGYLSFYNIKSISRISVLEKIIISGFLNEDGSVIIYFSGLEIIDILSGIKENLIHKSGLNLPLLPNTPFFKGSIMDGFNYNHLSEEISTYIVNGNVVPFSKTQRASSIGKLKRVEDIIHLNSSLRITYNNNLSENETHSKRQSLGINISMQFKQAVA